MSNFDEVARFTFNAEGKVSNDPNDTGKYTIYGISSKSYPHNVAKMKKWIEEGKSELAFAEAKRIYKQNYWDKAGCEKMEFKMAMVVFDCAINSGVSRAKKILKESLGNWKYYLMARISFMTQCRTEKWHLRGWTKRVARLYRFLNDR
ncbi:MAG: hypothetical protein E3J83_03230 [Candidatus Atribacteria bacterium]|nr:MAG: hypothetical protein E3J83_03230 [Candidatus Atribacteria bacterium]